MPAPEAVVVDITDGYTWARDAYGAPFTVEAAREWAAGRNAAHNVPSYRVFRLVEDKPSQDRQVRRIETEVALRELAEHERTRP